MSSMQQNRSMPQPFDQNSTGSCVKLMTDRLPPNKRLKLAARVDFRELARSRRRYGQARWRKRKGIAGIKLADGVVRLAELHWYEGGRGRAARNQDQALS